MSATNVIGSTGASKCSAAIISPSWASLAFVAMVVAYFSADSDHQFTGALICAFTFAAVQWLFPACRPVAKTPLCPWNWALFLFVLKLLVVPFSILIDGPSLGVLPHLPGNLSINLAMLMDASAFASFSGAYQYFSSRVSSKEKINTLKDSSAKTEPTPNLAAAFLVIGVLGLFLAFGTVGSFLNYFLDPATYIDLFVQASHTFTGVASLALRPFLGFGSVSYTHL